MIISNDGLGSSEVKNPSRKTVKVLLFIFFILLFCFEAGLSFYNYLPHKIDVSGIPVNEHLDWRVKSIIQERWYLTIEGFAFNKNESPVSPSFSVLLKNLETGVYYQLSTYFDIRWDVPDLYGIDKSFINSGFGGKTVMKMLQLHQNSYQIYIGYRDHGKIYLIDTDKRIPFEND